MASTDNCSTAVFAEELNGSNETTKKESIIAGDQGLLNAGEDDEMEIFGYKRNVPMTLITWIIIFLSLGLVRLLFHWLPHWILYTMYRRCPLNEAERVLIVDNYEGKYKSYLHRPVKYLSIKEISDVEIQKNNGTNRLISVKTRHGEVSSQIQSVTIHLNDGSRQDISHMKCIHVKKTRYVWSENRGKFQKLVGLDYGLTTAQLHLSKGYSAHEQFLRKCIYGENQIDVPTHSVLTLILLEVLNPFYVFQAFSLVLWYFDDYVYYMGAIIIMSLFGISSSVIQTQVNQRTLLETVRTLNKITVRRNNGPHRKTVNEEIFTTDLVPGDVIIIPPNGFSAPCDIALLSGTCIANESMLTGESVPVIKTALPNANLLYNKDQYANHTLFSGTNIMQVRRDGGKKDVLGVVLRTGYLTTKGSLVRSILYPPPTEFNFDKDTYRFIWILATFAVVSAIYTAVMKMNRGKDIDEILKNSLDIFTIVIPPALPAAMTVGRLYALRRLKKSKISCMNSRVINVCGSIDCLCFDKTGTLTGDGLDMWGVIPVENNVELGSPVKDVIAMPDDHPLKLGMATCHSLILFGKTISGDPLDIRMFGSTDWRFGELEADDCSKPDVVVPSYVKNTKYLKRDGPIVIELVHQFHFSSSLQRMSMITQTRGDPRFIVYTKGSPEVIQSLCVPSTVPSAIITVLRDYTEKGYRVIALAYKVLGDCDLVRIPILKREEVECNLTFAGLVVLENRLKVETTPVIKELREANMKIVMATGDNIFTAISVAKECGIVLPSATVFEIMVDEGQDDNPIIYYTASRKTSLMRSSTVPQTYNLNKNDLELEAQVNEEYSFAMTGQTWAVIRDKFPTLLPRILVRGAVFARMTPEQKQQLVQELKNIGYYVAMCGDGANDCGALRAAHAGVSLSWAESSVAAPFTSRIPNIGCVPRIIREGRAALVTSFGIFKCMVLYSLLEFTSVFILYGVDDNLTDLQFLFIDVCLVMNLMCSFGRCAAHPGPLHREPPHAGLLSFAPAFSMLAHLTVMASTQAASARLVRAFPWYAPPPPPPYDGPAGSYENYAVYAVSQFQYIVLAFVYSRGKPYRGPVHRNAVFAGSLLTMTAVCAYLTLSPAEWIRDRFELRSPPSAAFPCCVIALAALDCVLCTAVERLVVDRALTRTLKPRRRRRRSVDRADAGPGWSVADAARRRRPPITRLDRETVDDLEMTMITRL